MEPAKTAFACRAAFLFPIQSAEAVGSSNRFRSGVSADRRQYFRSFSDGGPLPGRRSFNLEQTHFEPFLPYPVARLEDLAAGHAHLAARY